MENNHVETDFDTVQSHTLMQQILYGSWKIDTIFICVNVGSSHCCGLGSLTFWEICQQDFRESSYAGPSPAWWFGGLDQRSFHILQDKFRTAQSVIPPPDGPQCSINLKPLPIITKLSLQVLNDFCMLHSDTFKTRTSV